MTDANTKQRAAEFEGLLPSESDRDSLFSGDSYNPHSVLGAHPMSVGAKSGVAVRAFHPEAVHVEYIPEKGEALAMLPLHEGGLWGIFLSGAALPIQYRLRFQFRDGSTWEREDPYRFLPTISEQDLYYLGEGSHRRLWRVLGAHPKTVDGVEGTSFAVWAPNARRVSVVGDFTRWDGRLFPMRELGSSGVFELFLPGLAQDAVYKFEIKTPDGELLLKADPFASASEVPPRTASRVFASSYSWEDAKWMDQRRSRDPHREPMAAYEVHLGSWARVPEEDNRSLSYREIAPKLVAHLKRFGFTHLELMPVLEHPLSDSWGYQVSGYYAPTSRFGSPDDFRFLVDLCHQNDIGVIVDWVPAHFPKDDFALRQFDGTPLYEHEDPRLAEHPDWGTLIFNYSRTEVRNFLIANALYWLEEFHIDGLRVDAVASMIYLDYSRSEGQWIPNQFGGRENLDAVKFLQEMNSALHADHPGCFTIAEESTSWTGVSRPVWDGGLGFTFKWNMGWMHDTLGYFERDPVYRRYHQDELSFAMIYEYTENFVMPLSHDEVVHGKRSLLEKMPGDLWQKFANLRLLLTYQYTRPGKKLLFMGTEIAPPNEWDCNRSLDWHLADTPERVGLGQFLEDLGQLYLGSSCLWREDHEPSGFAWIDMNDRDNSVLAYLRWDGENHLVIAMNLTPTPRAPYRIGVPRAGRYHQRFSSSDRRYHGGEFETVSSIEAEPIPFHNQPYSIELRLPPLGAVIMEPSAEND